MSTIDPPAGWDEVDGINTNERLLGGLSGPLNRAVTGLTARSKQLRDWRESDQAALASATGAGAVGIQYPLPEAQPQTLTGAVTANAVTPESFRRAGFSDDYAVQKALDAADDVYLPAGITYTLQNGLVMNRPGATLRGPGRLVAGSVAMGNLPIVKVLADGCTLDGLRIENPSEYFQISGERQYGVSIEANRTVVRGCLIRQCQQGISVRATGEWYDNVIIGNRVLDCIGIGAYAVPQNFGEDRGDGITTWGARTAITGNVVTCKAGYDARIGIHAEGLPTFAPVPGDLLDKGCTVTGNVVFGPFRRGIVMENVSRYAITGNVLAGGNTWWALAIILDSDDGVVSGNTIYYNRDPAVVVPFTPLNAAVYYRSNDAGLLLDEAIFANNTIHLGPLATASRAVAVQGVGTGLVRGLTIEGNRIFADAAVAQSAIMIQNAQLVDVVNNSVRGTFQNIVSVSTSADSTVKGNKGTKSSGTDYTLANVTGATILDGNVCIGGNGTMSATGTLGNLFAGPGNIGFNTLAGAITAANLADITHRANTFGKYAGRPVTTGTASYVASGSTAASTWLNVVDGTSVTPV